MRVAHEDEAATPEQLAGRAIARLRAERGWTQGHLARLMRDAYGYEWAQSAVARSERGERPLRLNEVVHLAGLFRVPVTTFLVDPAVEAAEADDAVRRAEERVTAARAALEDSRPALITAITAMRDAEVRFNKLAAEVQAAEAELEIARGTREIAGRGGAA